MKYHTMKYKGNNYVYKSHRTIASLTEKGTENNVDLRDHSNELFVKSELVKLREMMEFRV